VVRRRAREVTQAIIDLLVDAEHVVLDDRASTEEWAGCCAVADSLTYGTHYNGVLYSAHIVFTSDVGIDVGRLHEVLAPVGIGWHDDDPGIGAVGIFRVAVDTTRLHIRLTTPCYFIRELGVADGGTLPAVEITTVTGFLTRSWVRRQRSAPIPPGE
jgi:hypothetical protein